MKQDDYVLAIGLGLIAGALGTWFIPLGMAFIGLCYVVLSWLFGALKEQVNS